MLSDLLDAETGVRGFVLTGDSAYLAPYERGAAAMHGTLDQLSALTAGDPAQAPQISRLQYLVTDRLTLLVEMQQFAPVTGSTVHTAMLRTMDEGKGLMDTIRSVLGDLSAEESSIVHARVASLDSARHFSLLLAVIGTPVRYYSRSRLCSSSQSARCRGSPGSRRTLDAWKGESHSWMQGMTATRSANSVG